MSPEQRQDVFERLKEWASLPQNRESGVVAYRDILEAWFPSADSDSELLPIARAVSTAMIDARKAKATATKGKSRLPRVKPLNLGVRPKGEEVWYSVPSDPDYAVSNRLGVIRLTPTKRYPAGQRLTPRLRYFCKQWHAQYRLYRKGKPADVSAACLLFNATRDGKKAARERGVSAVQGSRGTIPLQTPQTRANAVDS